MSVIDFRQATIPARIPDYFGGRIIDEFRVHLEDRADLAEGLEAVRALFAQHVRDEREPGDVHNAYDDMMDLAQGCVNFIGFCLKNIGVLQPLLPRLKAKLYSPSEKSLIQYSDEAFLYKKLNEVRDIVFEGSRVAKAMMSERVLDIRAAEDPSLFCNIFLREPGEPIFNDWVEWSFLERYDLPLDRLPRTNMVDGMIKNTIHSMNYCSLMLRNLREGDLLVTFPALALDVRAPERAQLQDIYRVLAAHVPSFTPSQAAHNVRHHSSAPQGLGTP